MITILCYASFKCHFASWGIPVRKTTGQRRDFSVNTQINEINFIIALVGVVGEMDKNNDYYIWSHKMFEIGYNGRQVCITFKQYDKIWSDGTLAQNA